MSNGTEKTGGCEEILARLMARAESIRGSLEIGSGDVERVHRLWESMPGEEKKAIVGLAVERLYSDPETGEKLLGAGVTRDFLARHLLEVTGEVCRGEPGGSLGAATLLAAVNAIIAGVDLGVVLGAVSLIGSRVASKSPDVETALSVSKIYLWCAAMLTESYTSIYSAVLERASGISSSVIRNLVKAYSSDLKERVSLRLSQGGLA